MEACDYCGRELVCQVRIDGTKLFCDDDCYNNYHERFPYISPSSHAVVEGVGPEQPIVTNERGGKQAQNDYAFHLIDADALFQLAKVMGEGAKKYAKDNWKKIPAEDHFDHLQMHLLAWSAGDRQDEHLQHALARVMMLYVTAKSEGKL